MTDFQNKGQQIRELCKSLVIEYMQATPDCKPNSQGMKQAQIFRNCGLDWGTYPLVTSSNQQYWIVAILAVLQEEGKIERVSPSGPWRLV
jgi:hypothetical protein